MNRITHMNWDITGKCNLSCRHCFTADVYNNMRDLDTEQAQRAIDVFVEEGVRSIAIQGREPLIRRDLVSILQYAARKGLICTLCTNGTLLRNEKQVHELLNSGVSALYFSLDGARAEDNDRMRGEGVFAEVIDAIRMCVERNEAEFKQVDVFVSFTLSNANKAHCIDMVEVCNDLGVDRLYIGVAAPLGRGRVHKGELITSRREIFWAVDRMIARSLEFKGGTRLFLKGSSPREITFYNVKHGTDFPVIYPSCALLEGSYFMKPNGDLYPCSSWLSAQKVTALDIFKVRGWNVRTHSLQDITKSPYYARVQQFVRDTNTNKRADICPDCDYSEVCKLCPLSVLLLGEEALENCRVAAEAMGKLSLHCENMGPPEELFPALKRDLMWNVTDDVLEVWSVTSDYTLKRTFQLNPVGKRIWEMIHTGTPSFADLASAVEPKKPNIAIPRNDILHDVVQFVNRLRFEGFVEVKRIG
ncbi:MAG: PqqD family peptide modification chaperone [Gemmatimonadota bacterium]|nr:MAG: PqqD family peptide modification chaperone [Gemmatimonadota bacterium]